MSEVVQLVEEWHGQFFERIEMRIRCGHIHIVKQRRPQLIPPASGFIWKLRYRRLGLFDRREIRRRVGPKHEHGRADQRVLACSKDQTDLYSFGERFYPI